MVLRARLKSAPPSQRCVGLLVSIIRNKKACWLRLGPQNYAGQSREPRSTPALPRGPFRLISLHSAPEIRFSETDTPRRAAAPLAMKTLKIHNNANKGGEFSNYVINS